MVTELPQRALHELRPSTIGAAAPRILVAEYFRFNLGVSSRAKPNTHLSRMDPLLVVEHYPEQRYGIVDLQSSQHWKKAPESPWFGESPISDTFYTSVSRHQEVISKNTFLVKTFFTWRVSFTLSVF